MFDASYFTRSIVKSIYKQMNKSKPWHRPVSLNYMFIFYARLVYDSVLLHSSPDVFSFPIFIFISRRQYFYNRIGDFYIKFFSFLFLYIGSIEIWTYHVNYPKPSSSNSLPSCFTTKILNLVTNTSMCVCVCFYIRN